MGTTKNSTSTARKTSSIFPRFRKSTTKTTRGGKSYLSQFFTSAPTLSEGFIQDQPPFDRVVAVPSEPHFIFDCYFRLICARPMPVYSVPGSMDSF
jgi:hypothetical protein